MTTLDPWNGDINISLIPKYNSNNRIILNIKGPINRKGNRENIFFTFNRTSKEYLTVSANLNVDVRTVIDLTKKIAIIKYVEKIIIETEELYSGSDMMKLLLKILKDLYINEVILEDQSGKECINRLNNNFGMNKRNLIMNRNYTNIKKIFGNKVSYNISSLLKNNRTFYMKFSFKPYQNGINKTKNINNNIKILKLIKWE